MAGGNKDGPSRCPGEDNCNYWQGSATKSEESVCKAIQCSLYPTKNRKQATGLIERVVNAAEYWRNHRNSGFGLPTDKVTPMEREAIIYLDANERDYYDFQNVKQLETLLIFKAAYIKEK